MKINPFSFGNPIRDSSRFIGRQEEMGQIVSRLLSSAHESTSVVGERRIGKTSLLKHLENPDIAESLGLGRENYCLVYIDFQGLTDITPLRFWQRVLRKMARSMSDENLISSITALRKNDVLDLFDLEDLFEEISDAEIHVVLLMDEFEYVTQNPNFGSDFFGGLRALAIHYNLSLVPATRRELVDLCHSEEIKGSPFFNIFATIVLRPFSQEEASLLLQNYTQNSDIEFSNQNIDFILKLAGGYPFFTQMAGVYLCQGLDRDMKEEELYEYVIQEFYQQAAHHFSYFWSHSSESGRITLLATMALNNPKQKKKKAKPATKENIKNLYGRAELDINKLLKRGLLIYRDEEYHIFSPIFQQWISYEISAKPGEEEGAASVEQWMREGGDEKLNPVKGVLPRFKKKYWSTVGIFVKDFAFDVIENVTASMIFRGMM